MKIILKTLNKHLVEDLLREQKTHLQRDAQADLLWT